MKEKILLLGCWAIITLIVPEIAIGESTGSISGMVVDKSTLQTLSGVSIIINRTKSGLLLILLDIFRSQAYLREAIRL
ncbi:MAG TPA: hypothetical protein VMT04_10040 [Terriglobales bacterium]|nr:hypothetical protein [Terriglobales bacterium]